MNTSLRSLSRFFPFLALQFLWYNFYALVAGSSSVNIGDLRPLKTRQKVSPWMRASTTPLSLPPFRYLSFLLREVRKSLSLKEILTRRLTYVSRSVKNGQAAAHELRSSVSIAISRNAGAVSIANNGLSKLLISYETSGTFTPRIWPRNNPLTSRTIRIAHNNLNRGNAQQAFVSHYRDYRVLGSGPAFGATVFFSFFSFFSF